MNENELKLLDAAKRDPMYAGSAESTPALTCTPPAKGFPGIRCILCGDADAVITLDLDDGETLRCATCEGAFTTDDVRELCAAWTHAVSRIDRMFAD